ncbi:MAG TPA: hypothetical protein VN841_29220 [Bryobacteraceae bacterium]|nr:hypothetical protein [Bryobacteraceae bacterium]
MPGALAAAAPSGVLPQNLCTAFQESRLYPELSVAYHDGTQERGLITDASLLGGDPPSSVRTWKLARRLKAADLATLRMFFEQQQGGLIPFYFYNPFEPNPGSPIGSNYDASGTAIQGRHTCVFRGNWTETIGLGRSDTQIEIAEIA